MVINTQLLDHTYDFLFKAAEVYVPMHGVIREGFTLIPKKQPDAFTLVGPIAGQIKDPRNSNPIVSLEDQDSFILRTVIGTSMAKELQTNFPLGVLSLSGVINAAVTGAYLQYGNKIERITFKRPGEKGYFRELENHAGFELRLFGKFKE